MSFAQVILHSLMTKYGDYIVKMRRYFRMHPETGNREFNTQKVIMEELRGMGLTPRPIGTGVVADIVGVSPGETVAIRADIDALPIPDELDADYRSQNAGVCHACGHDGHTAMLLGIGKALVDMQAELSGTIRLLFQPSEELLPGGALQFIEGNALNGVTAIIGAHLWQPQASGTVGMTDGRFMASGNAFDIYITGKSGHCSMPHQAVDAALLAAQVTAAISTVASRNVNPLEPVIVAVGALKAGEVANVIAEKAEINGVVRTYDTELLEKIFERIERITKGICLAAGANCEIQRTYGYPPVINDAGVAKILRAAAGEVLGQDNVMTITPVMGAEDFAYYQQKVPGAFCFIGIGSEAKGIVYPQHHPKFNIDEEMLPKGAEILLTAALKLLQAKTPTSNE